MNDPSWKWTLEHPGEVPPHPLKSAWAASRKRLFQLIDALVQWENTSNEDVLQQAREEIHSSWQEVCALNKDHPQASVLFDPDRLPALHDPFAGGGTIPLEAQRLGLVAHASDLNPVAVLINKAMIDLPPRFAHRPPVHPDAWPAAGQRQWKGTQGLVEDIRRYGAWVREEAEKHIGHLYPKVAAVQEADGSWRHATEAEQPSSESRVKVLPVIAWIWARTVKSPHPAFSHVDVPLTSTFVLSRKGRRETFVQPVIEEGEYRFTVRVGRAPLGAQVGTKTGHGANFRCILSQVAISRDYIEAEGQAGRLGARLMAIVAEDTHNRVYLPASRALEEAAKNVEPTWKPSGPIPAGLMRSTRGLFGLKEWSDLFTRRQCAALTTLSEAVGDAAKQIRVDAIASGFPDDGKGIDAGGTGATAYAQAVSVYLGLALSRVTEQGSSLCTWESSPSREGLRTSLIRHALSMTWDFAERYPFSEASGPWLNAVDWITKAVDKLPSNPLKGTAEQLNAEAQPLSCNTFVSTDLPYYDNIGYADLSEFYYIWMRHALRDLYPALFATESVPKAEELVASSHRHGGKEDAEVFYLAGMTRNLQHLARQAHPSAPISLYFVFNSLDPRREAGTPASGWETFLSALFDAGLALTGTWPMRTELGQSIFGGDTYASASTVVLVCRKRAPGTPTCSRRQFLRELNAVLPEALDEMTRGSGGERSPLVLNDLSPAIIGPGMAVFSRYSAVLEPDGTPMTLRTALHLIHRVLTEEDFDADSRFCLRWFEQWRWNEGPFGEADVLARAKRTSLEAMTDAGVITSGEKRVRLCRLDESPAAWDPLRDSSLPLWVILHHLVRALRNEGVSGASLLLNTVKSKADVICQLAYRLHTLTERQGWMDEARACRELIAAWSELEALADVGLAPSKSQT